MKNNNKSPLDDSNDNSGNKNMVYVSNSKITLNIKPLTDISNVEDTTDTFITINPLFGKITPINIINSELFNKPILPSMPPDRNDVPNVRGN